MEQSINIQGPVPEQRDRLGAALEPFMDSEGRIMISSKDAQAIALTWLVDQYRLISASYMQPTNPAIEVLVQIAKGDSEEAVDFTQKLAELKDLRLAEMKKHDSFWDILNVITAERESRGVSGG